MPTPLKGLEESLVPSSAEEVGWLSIDGPGMEFVADFGSTKTVATRLRELGYATVATWMGRQRGPWAYLNVISVRSTEQGRGTGSALMRHGLRRLHELGARKLIGMPSPDRGRMVDLLRFYERFGIGTQSIGGQLWLVGPIAAPPKVRNPTRRPMARRPPVGGRR